MSTSSRFEQWMENYSDIRPYLLIKPSWNRSHSRLQSVVVALFRAAALSVVLAVILAGCGSYSALKNPNTAPPSDFPGHALETVLEALPSYPEAMVEVYAEAQVAISSPDEKGRFTAKISYSSPDSMIVRVRFPLGIEGARVLMAGDSAYVYDRIKNVLYSGSPERIVAVLPGAVAGVDLIQIATGFVTPDHNTNWILTSDSLRYFLNSPDETVRYSIDPNIWRIDGYRLTDDSGTILEQRWYMDFELMDHILIPRRTILTRPAEDTRLSMAIRRFDTDPGPLDFNLGLKSDTDHIYLGQ